jgi:hypothetical protein
MFLGSNTRPVREADNLTAICETVAETMWHPQHLTTLLLPVPVTSITFLYVNIVNISKKTYACTACY